MFSLHYTTTRSSLHCQNRKPKTKESVNLLMIYLDPSSTSTFFHRRLLTTTLIYLDQSSSSPIQPSTVSPTADAHPSGRSFSVRSLTRPHAPVEVSHFEQPERRIMIVWSSGCHLYSWNRGSRQECITEE